MKCSHCGGNLSLKDEYCPHCGQFNEQSAQHIRDMRQYSGRFNETHRSVWARVWKYQSVSVRVVVLAVVVILIIAVYFADLNLYSIERWIQDARSSGKVSENVAQLEEYLEDENYIDLYYFMYANRIGMYSYLDDPYAAYWPLRMGCLYYTDVYQDLLLFATQDGNAGRNYLTNLESELDSFYDYTTEDELDYDEYAETREETLEAFTDMRTKVNALLIAYCGLTEEEAAQFPDMDSAKRAVLLKERAAQ